MSLYTICLKAKHKHTCFHPHRNPMNGSPCLVAAFYPPKIKKG